MVGIRKVCINVQEMNNTIHHNNSVAASGGEMYSLIRVPEPRYLTARFAFRPDNILDWFIDPENDNKDIIVWLSHRGELRFEYDPVLETKLETIFSIE